jgi:hypothetical protein
MRRAHVVATIAVLVVLAWATRFVQDDAFISFRYAQHLAEGHGLTWNVGEPPIQGFTDPLWTLALAAAMRMGAEPVATTYALGIASFVGTLAGTYALVRALGSEEWAAWTAMVWYGTNATALAYATGGLETQTQACLVTWVAVLAVRELEGRGTRAGAVGLSLLGAAAVWLRLDSALPVGLLVGAAALRPGVAARRRAELVAPLAAGSLAFVAFALGTFHQLLPNTFYAKAAGFDPKVVKAGAEYVLAFLRHYGLLPYLVLAAVLLWRATPRDRAAVLLAGCVVSWMAYVTWVGGDFMEFRFIVPVLPLAFAALARLIFASALPRAVVPALAAVVVAESAAHAYEMYDESFFQDGNAIETIHGLSQHLEAPNQDWCEVGRVLGRAFRGDPRVTITTAAAGAMPYYSRLRTVDILGLSDAWIARHGKIIGRRPGHRRLAPVSYLLEQRVNLAWFHFQKDDPLPPDTKVIHVPITPQLGAELVYLVPSEAVDEVVRREGWAVTPYVWRP